MRVIAGSYRGRLLETLENMTIRPTADRVKESLFNIISGYIIDADFLDIFSGSGAIGIEALSRGAKSASFVDSNAESIDTLRKNLLKLKIINNIDIYHADYHISIEKFKTLKRKFDIIFIDPPYLKGFAQDALIAIDKAKILSENGIIAVEHDQNDIMPEKVGEVALLKQKKYGITKLSFYVYKKDNM